MGSGVGAFKGTEIHKLKLAIQGMNINTLPASMKLNIKLLKDLGLKVL